MNKYDRSIGFIGIGVLGKGLALSLAKRGYPVVAAYSRSRQSAQWISDRVPGCRALDSAQELAEACDLVFLTTPDSVIGEVAAAVNWRVGQGVVHCSGVASVEILDGPSRQGAVTGAFHPFQTFAGLEYPEQTLERLAGVAIAVSGEGWVASFLRELAQELGGHWVSIRDSDRPLYHASAVLGCGYLAALLQAAVALWREMGFSEQESINALYSLARATLDNISENGVAPSVTGPMVRGDTNTVELHLAALARRKPDLLPLYIALANASLPLAAQTGVGDRPLKELQKLINDYHRRCLPCPE